MKAFEFSLQKSLEARQAQEKAAEFAFGKAMRALHKAEKERDRLQNSLWRHANAMADLAGARTTPPELAGWTVCLEAMRAQLDVQTNRVAEGRRAVETLRKALADKMRDRKVMEQLQARERLRWLTELRRAERRDMDEIASLGFVRHRREAARTSG
jgi:flagellar export protein FliJ